MRLFSQKLLDYEVDSDDEWEEEEPGESLSHSEGVSADREQYGFCHGPTAPWARLLGQAHHTASVSPAELSEDVGQGFASAFPAYLATLTHVAAVGYNQTVSPLLDGHICVWGLPGPLHALLPCWPASLICVRPAPAPTAHNGLISGVLAKPHAVHRDNRIVSGFFFPLEVHRFKFLTEHISCFHICFHILYFFLF